MPENNAPPPRRSRRYLIDPRFQLKYTGMLVSVVLAVMLALGAVIWQTAHTASAQAEFASIQAERALEEARTSAKLLKSNAAQVDDPSLAKSLEDDLAAIDREHAKNLADVKARRAEVEQQRRKMAMVLAIGSLSLLVVLMAMGVFISQSTRIYDRTTGEISYGRVPPGSVVVPGSLPSSDGKYSLACAVIVKRVDAKTRAKTSINDLLRATD